MKIVVGISGVTCGGKSSLTGLLTALLKEDGVVVKVVSQDPYFKDPAELEWLSELNHWNFDVASAVNFQCLEEDLEKQLKEAADGEVLVVEGNLIFSQDRLRDLCHLRYFITLDYEQCRQRRILRTDYVPPDVPGYLDGCVWPEYLRHLGTVRALPEPPLELDGTQQLQPMAERLAVHVLKLRQVNWLRIQSRPLSIESVKQFVLSPSSGAISMFLGTTRDNFDGKTVVKLEYEAYEPMAKKLVGEICSEMREKWPEVERIAIWHRIGQVDVTETSVLIAVSSPHRRQAQDASRFCIDRLKETIPIWKKEVYSDGSADWKQNCESGW